MSPFSSSAPLSNDAIARELDAGERVLWSGQPDPTRLKRKAIPQLLFSIPLAAFVGFWMWDASGAARATWAAGKSPPVMDIIFPAFGLFAVAIVLFLTLSPWLEESKARRTFYALTDRRALVVVEGRKREIKSVLPAQFQIERVELPGGRGDIILRRQTKGSANNESIEVTGFYGIENAREVERLTRELASGR